jgi:hypothetical protein
MRHPSPAACAITCPSTITAVAGTVNIRSGVNATVIHTESERTTEECRRDSQIKIDIFDIIIERIGGGAALPKQPSIRIVNPGNCFSR